MDLVQAIVLAIVQGLSEFLPISSSGHLVLIPHFLGWPDQGLAFDVALHLGTLAALILYFRGSLVTLLRAWGASIVQRTPTRESRLAWQLLVATIPVSIVGLLFNHYIEEHLRQPLFIAGTLTFFGLLMYVADRWGRGGRTEFDVSWPEAIAIGCAQALALMPGTSRSGITMTAGRAFGLTRLASARFSFLLSMPITLAAVMYTLLLKSRELSNTMPVTTLLVGVVTSAVFGFLAIRFLLGVLRRTGFGVFALYRVLLGLALFAWWGLRPH